MLLYSGHQFHDTITKTNREPYKFSETENEVKRATRKAGVRGFRNTP